MTYRTRVRDYFDLFRFSLGVLSCITVLAAGFIVYVLKGNSPNFIEFFFNNGVLEWPGLVLGLVATLLLASAIEAINDVYDVETDIANKRYDRPIARGAFSREYVRNLTSLFFIISVLIIGMLVLVYQMTFLLLLFTLFCVLVGIGYNYIKRTGFIGNMWVSIGYVAPLFIGFFLLKPNEDLIILNCFLMLTATFFLATGREIIKDIQDYSGDLESQLNSLAVKIGPEKAGFVAMIFFAIAILCATLSGIFVYQNLIFWLLLAVLIMILSMTSYTILTEPPTSGGRKARKYTRWSLWIALGAFLLGIFFIP
ncbi:MAG: UbiA family prenyltransferase [Candidatus Hodarchaeota archaeon]